MDPAELRASFPVFERIAYLNAGSDGPLPAAAVKAAQDALAEQGSGGRTYEHFGARGELNARLRTHYAERLGAPESDVALTTSTSEGCAKVIAGLELGEGDEILTSDAEHPGLVGPLLAARARGVTVRSGPLATLADHVTDATSLIACSHVGWISGELADPRLGATGTPYLLDGAQGIGAVPVDLEALGCMAYAGAGQKWLCGADGTGMLWIDPEWQPRVHAPAPAYMAFTDAAAGLDSGLHPDMRRHDTPTLAREVTVTSVVAGEVLGAFGWDNVHERAIGLAARLAEMLAERGFTVGPRGDTTLVSWEDAEPESTSARLAGAGIVVRFLPSTPYLRASVGAWNDESDLDRLLEAL